MGKKKKIILIFAVLLLLLLSSLLGPILYYYYHPSQIKPLIENVLSRTTGTRCTIQELLYSVEGRTIGAKGIILSPGREGEGFHLNIPQLRAEVSLEGPFRHKTLIIKTLRLDGLTLELSRAFSLPEIKGMKESPSLFSRTLRGLAALLLFRDVRLETLELANGRLSGRLGEQVFDIKDLSAKVNEDRLLDISCSALVQWPSRESSLFAPALHITTDQAVSLADPQIKGVLDMADARVQAPEGAVEKMALRAAFNYDHARKTVRFDSLDARLEGLSLKDAGGTKSTYPRADLKAKGLLLLKGFQLELHDFHVTLGDLLDLKGGLRGEWAGRPRFDLQGLTGHLVPMKILPLLPDHLKAMVGPMALAGRVSLLGDMGGLKEPEAWRWHCALKARLNGNRFSYETSGIRLDSRLFGEIQATGPLTGPSITLNIRGDATSLSGIRVSLEPFEMRLSLAGKYPLFELKDLSAHIPQAGIEAGKKAVLIQEIRAQARTGALDIERKILSLPHLELQSSLLKNMILSLEIREDRILVALKGQEMGIISAGAGLNLSPPGWTFKGVDTIQAQASLEMAGGWAFDAFVALQELGLENRDSSCIGEKIVLRVELKGAGDLTTPRLTLAASIQVEGGEILYDRFYLDLAKNPFLCTWKGQYDTARNLVEIEDFKIGLRNIISLAAKGSVGKKGRDNRVRLSVSMPEVPLLPAFRHFLLEPYKREKPFLAALEMGGVLSADLEVEGDGEDWTLKGHSRWREGKLSSVDGAFSLQGIDLDLPLWYRLSFAGDPSGDRGKKENPPAHGAPVKEEALEGNLSIQSMNLPVIPGQPLSLPLTATPNGLSVVTPTKVKMPGGEIEVGPIACRVLLNAAPSLVTSLTFKNLDLAPLLSKIWPRPVQGFAEGRLDPVRLEGHEVRSRGQISVEAFGGEFLLSNLAASGIFTSAPLFHVDAECRNLHMAELTKETSFGKIEGIMEGRLKNLEIAYGQPQRFDLLLETIEREGIPRKISVRAVDNIAQIGGGHSPFIGMAGVLTSFLREFPYEKIGIRASLENDVFRINGTIKEGGKEYIIKRGGFSGVNVVNQNPDNLISFKDMVKRIRRVTGSKSGPVVK